MQERTNQNKTLDEEHPCEKTAVFVPVRGQKEKTARKKTPSHCRTGGFYTTGSGHLGTLAHHFREQEMPTSKIHMLSLE